MNIVIKDFKECYVNDAAMLAIREFQEEKKHCPCLPSADFSDNIKGVISWLCGQGHGKAAICDNKLVGYILFAGPWDGFIGNVKGVFSPLGGSAFSYEYEKRDRIASKVFESIAKELSELNVYSYALSRYAHDEETAKAFILNGFGIRCSDAVLELSDKIPVINSGKARFCELSADNFHQVKRLQRGLHKHLAGSPAFCPTVGTDFEHWFENWIKRETMRIFVAKVNENIIGFIAVDNTGENFITEYRDMKNICGAYFDENFRGGPAKELLSYICNTLKTEGNTHLGVDYETLNPTALNFWQKAFTPYTYSFARRLDERIAQWNMD